MLWIVLKDYIAKRDMSTDEYKILNFIWRSNEKINSTRLVVFV